MPDLESLLDQVDEMRDEIVALEQDLVRIPTCLLYTSDAADE